MMKSVWWCDDNQCGDCGMCIVIMGAVIVGVMCVVIVG